MARNATQRSGAPEVSSIFPQLIYTYKCLPAASRAIRTTRQSPKHQRMPPMRKPTNRLDALIPPYAASIPNADACATDRFPLLHESLSRMHL